MSHWELLKSFRANVQRVGSPRLRSRMGTASAVVVAVAALLILAGCRGSSPVRDRREGTAIEAIRARSAIFESLSATLNDLPNEVDTQLRPSQVVVDATTSRDQRTVEAVLVDHPAHPSGHFNYLYVPRRNGRFDDLVEPGDIVYYYANTDSDGGRPTQLSGKVEPFRLIVAQVDGPDGLFIAGEGATEPISTPFRMEIWRLSDDKLKAVQRRLDLYVKKNQPPIHWEPTPDEKALRKIVEWLNQWSRGQSPGAWKPDPLVASLSDELLELVPEEELTQTTFQTGDGRFLQQSVWLRDVSTWGGSDQVSDEVQLAAKLFDWTVRNIHLETRKDASELGGSRIGLAYFPWQAMLYGRGTAEERAWVFAALCRQQGLNVVILQFGEGNVASFLQPWLAALWHDGKLFLFDPKLGLPIPAAQPNRIATLSEVRSDPSLLRALDLSETKRYPLTASEVKQAGAQIVAEPAELSWRMRNLEGHLAGEERITLTVDAAPLADELKNSGLVDDVRLWEFPLRTLERQMTMDQATRERARAEFEVFWLRPKLWKARVLHFQGTFEGPDGAKAAYRDLRLSDEEIEKLPTDNANKLLTMFAKLNASYWLGLNTYESGMYEVAVDYLKKRTLEAMPKGPWSESARYNLARAYEQLGRYDEAIALYEADQSAQRYGNQLRARRLKAQKSADQSADQQAASEPIEEETQTANPAADEPPDEQ